VNEVVGKDKDASPSPSSPYRQVRDQSPVWDIELDLD